MGKRSGVLGIALVLMLAGCASADAEPAPSPTDEEVSFVDEMRATEAFFGVDDAQLSEIGQSVCAALRDGSSFDDLVDILALNDFNKDEASAIIFASSREYCPEQSE